MKNENMALKKVISTFEKGRLYCIVGQPTMGKSTLARLMAIELDTSPNNVITFFNLEISNIHFVNKVMRLLSGITGEDNAEYIVDYLKDSKIDLDDTAHIDLNTLQSKISEAVCDYNANFIFIDYLNLMNHSLYSVSESVKKSITYILRSLDMLAANLHITIVMLYQLERVPKKKPDEYSIRQDLHHIADATDQLYLAYRPGLYNRSENPHIIEVIKSRGDTFCGEKYNIEYNYNDTITE
ncbi:MAG: hypothetical protein IJY36_00035 [Coprobacter sp.]|nr:hypothetical protein [Coprobacter sp.]